MTEYHFQPLPALSAKVWPDKRDKVTVFTAYLDDSGSPVNPSGEFLTIAGYSSDQGGWAYFNDQWSAVLKGHGAPYLHMKEFGDPEGLYREIKRSPERERSFIYDLIQVIQTSMEFAVASTVYLPDLEFFNSESGLSLDPYALCIYGCFLEFSAEYRGWDSPLAGQLLFDRFDRASSRIATAEQYAATDLGGHFGIDEISASPVGASHTFRNILPLQAADFLAWESRKRCQDLAGWQPKAEDRHTLSTIQDSYESWAKSYLAENCKDPRSIRGSYSELRTWPRPQGNIWRKADLEKVNQRHPNGWLAQVQ